MVLMPHSLMVLKACFLCLLQLWTTEYAQCAEVQYSENIEEDSITFTAIKKKPSQNKLIGDIS